MMQVLLIKKFNPTERREPKGSAHGGRWTAGGGQLAMHLDDDPWMPPHERALVEFEEWAWNQPIEHCRAVDSAGNVVFERSGDNQSIEIPKERYASLRGCWFTHNHPGAGYALDHPASSFSPEDIFVLIVLGLTGMRAVGRYRMYEAWFDPGQVTDRNRLAKADHVLALYKRCESKVMERMWADISAGRVSLDQANAWHSHMVMSDVARQTPGFNYRMTERPDRVGTRMIKALTGAWDVKGKDGSLVLDRSIARTPYGSRSNRKVIIFAKGISLNRTTGNMTGVASYKTGMNAPYSTPRQPSEHSQSISREIHLRPVNQVLQANRARGRTFTEAHGRYRHEVYSSANESLQHARKMRWDAMKHLQSGTGHLTHVSDLVANKQGGHSFFVRGRGGDAHEINVVDVNRRTRGMRRPLGAHGDSDVSQHVFSAPESPVHGAAFNLGMAHHGMESRSVRTGFRKPRILVTRHQLSHKRPYQRTLALHSQLGGTHRVSSISNRRVHVGGRLRHVYSFSVQPHSGGEAHEVHVMRN